MIAVPIPQEQRLRLSCIPVSAAARIASVFGSKRFEQNAGDSSIPRMGARAAGRVVGVRADGGGKAISFPLAMSYLGDRDTTPGYDDLRILTEPKREQVRSTAGFNPVREEDARLFAAVLAGDHIARGGSQ